MLRAVLLLLLLLSVVTGGAASAVDEDDPAWSACWTSFEPLVCEAEDVHIPKVGCIGNCNWSLCSVKRPEFRHSVGVRGYARGWANGGFYQIPTMPDFVQVLDLSSIIQEDLPEGIFANVSHITGLILQDADLEDIDEETLIDLKNLTCINLDYNPQLGHFSSIDILKQLFLLPSLRRLSARHSHFLTYRTDPFFQENFSLLSLWLSGNSASLDFSMEAFKYLVVLRELDLSNCMIEGIKQDFLLPNSHRNKLPKTSNESFFEKDFAFFNLTVLDLSHNKIEALTSDLSWASFPRLEYLNLTHNSILVISAPSSGFAALRHLDLSSQNVPTVVEATILQIPSLLSLNLQSKNLTFKSQPLNMTNDAGFSKRNSKLRELYISGNALRLFNEQKLLDLLGHLHDLETLSLANSKLDFASATVFSNFPKLRVLILRDNAINVIPEGCFDSLTILSHLDLSNNKITVFSHRTFGEGLRARLDVVDLGENPIVCFCDLLWFRDWFMADSKLFSVSDPDYQCHNTPAKTQLADFTMHQQACLLSREVNEGIIFVCSFLTITSTAAVLLFRYRWHLRLVFFEAFRGQGDVRKWRLQHGRFKHDVFVSYAREDFAWIRQRLMPQLEDRLHLRLCIHDRQFIPGKNIVDNIADCVESSKKVMMVFSKHFVRSQWCQFELNYCLRHVMEHEDALIIVCLDNVTSLDIMTTAMMAVLKTTTYIQWAGQADAVRSFWGRLEIALDEILPAGEHAL